MVMDPWVAKRQRDALLARNRAEREMEQRAEEQAKAKQELEEKRPEPVKEPVKKTESKAFSSMVVQRSKLTHLALSKVEMGHRFTRTYCNAGIAPKKFVTLEPAEVTCEKCRKAAGI